MRLRAGSLEMDLVGAHGIARRPNSSSCNNQEFKLLEYLMRMQGRVVTRTMLLENVWDLNFDPGTNVVESHMSRRCDRKSIAGSPAK